MPIMTPFQANWSELQEVLLWQSQYYGLQLSIQLRVLQHSTPARQESCCVYLRFLLCSADEVWAAMHQEPPSHPSGTGVQAAASRAATLRRDTPSPVTFTYSQGARGGAAVRQERFVSAGIPEQEVSAPLRGHQKQHDEMLTRMQGVPIEPGCQIAAVSLHPIPSKATAQQQRSIARESTT